MPSEQFVSYSMVRTSNISMQWCRCCIRPTR